MKISCRKLGRSIMMPFCALSLLSVIPTCMVSAQPKKIYLAPDDHTDYMWTADEQGYQDAILKMLDYYIDLNDRTASEPYHIQSKWNCDGSYWLWLYSQHRSPEQTQRLLRQIREERITMPMNSLISIMGVAPLEATLRDMYYAGEMQRRHKLPFTMALSMEDQVLPLGLSSLWAGSGVKYSWRGVCACVTNVKGLDNRPHEIYWYKGLDDQRVMMKWYSVNPEFIKKPTVFRYNLGKYLEADNIPNAILDCQELLSDKGRYPYHIAGAFGKGGDALLTLTEDFPRIAREASSDEYQVIVSNEVDFFRDMERHYGRQLPSESLSYGTTEWGTAVASMAELSAAVKRSVEKLRTAELMQTLVARHDSTFVHDLDEVRRQAWFACGLYYEHDWTADSPDVTRKQRAEWQRKIAAQLFAYVDTLYDRSYHALGHLIAATDQERGDGGTTIFVLNPLGWTRTDYCDYACEEIADLRVVDLQTGQETPCQWVKKDGNKYLRLLARDIPSMGFKTFRIEPKKMISAHIPFIYKGDTLENNAYRLTLNRQGAITSLIDKRNGNRECIREIDGLTANDLGRRKHTKGIKGNNVRVEDVGPVSATLVAESYFPLKHTTRVTLFNDIDRIEVENSIDENFGNQIQTYAYSFNIDQPRIRTEEAGAILDVRQASQGGHYADSICRLDWVALNHFADISGKEGGVTLSNRDAYFMKTGHSTIDSLDVATPQVQVMVGGKVISWLGIDYQDGDTHFANHFALRPYNGSYDAASSMRFSLEHLNPLVAGRACGDGKGYGSQYSLLGVSSPDVLTWAVKPAEEGINKGIIVRLWNMSDHDQPCRLQTGWPLKRITKTTHVETDMKRVKGKQLRLGHHRLETFRLE